MTYAKLGTAESAADLRPAAIVVSMDAGSQETAARLPDAGVNLEARLEAVAREDRAAFDDVYAATVDRVISLVTRIVGDRQTADDVANDVYLQVWRQASRFDPARGSAIAWIMTISRSRALDMLRSRSSSESLAMEYDRHSRRESLAEDPAQDLLAATDSRTAVHGALQRLAAEERQLLALAFFRGYSHAELAQITGLPLGTVKTRIRRALLKLKHDMQERRAPAGDLT